MPTIRSPFLIASAALAALCGGSAFAVETEPPQPGMERPAERRSQPLEGQIASIDAEARNVRVREMSQGEIVATGEFREITIPENAKVKLDGEDASLEDLRVGDRTLIHLEEPTDQADQQQDPAQQDRGQQDQAQQEEGAAKLVRVYRVERAPFERQDGAQEGGEWSHQQPQDQGDQQNPMGDDQDPLGQQDPKGDDQDPLGQQDPKGDDQDTLGQQDPWGDDQDPLGQQDPKGDDQDPLGQPDAESLDREDEDSFSRTE